MLLKDSWFDALLSVKKGRGKKKPPFGDSLCAFPGIGAGVWIKQPWDWVVPVKPESGLPWPGVATFYNLRLPQPKIVRNR
jgi:hypothetical protein